MGGGGARLQPAPTAAAAPAFSCAQLSRCAPRPRALSGVRGETIRKSLCATATRHPPPHTRTDPWRAAVLHTVTLNRALVRRPADAHTCASSGAALSLSLSLSLSCTATQICTPLESAPPSCPPARTPNHRAVELRPLSCPEERPELTPVRCPGGRNARTAVLRALKVAAARLGGPDAEGAAEGAAQQVLDDADLAQKLYSCYKSLNE